MAYAPIAFVAPYYRKFKNYWFKAYEPGTTTPKLLASDGTGVATFAKLEVNIDGFLVSAGGAITTPFIDGTYDAYLFPTEAEADSNDTTNAERVADNLQGISQAQIGETIGDYSTYEFETVSDAQNGVAIGGETIILKAGDVIRIRERNSSLFDVVSGTAGVNGYEIIQHATLDISFVYRMESPINAISIGVLNDGADTTNAMQNAVDYAGSSGASGELLLPAGDYYITSTIEMPRIAGGIFNEKGLQITGESRGSTYVITDQDIAVFTMQDYCNFRHLTVEQRGTEGTGKAFFTSGQIRFCTFEDLNVIRFKYGCLFRYTLWLSWRDIYFVNNTCGVRLSRNDNQEDQTNPSAPGSWNQNPGWFNNQLTFDNILCNAGEIGIWASCMGATFNNVTCQNQETDGSDNQVLPTVATIPFNSGSVEPSIGDVISNSANGATAVVREIELTSGSWGGGDAAGIFHVDTDSGTWGGTNNINNDTTVTSNIATKSGTTTGKLGTGMWLEGGGTATDSFNNVLINYYVEDTLNSLVVKEHDSLVVSGWFTQGEANAHALLDITGSSITIFGQTGQVGGFMYKLLAYESTICSHGEIAASGAVNSLTSSLYSPTGVFPENTKLTTVTATPETSGTIVLDSSEDQLGYQRLGNIVQFTGRIDVLSVSSPVGTYITIDGLPFPAANLNERAGNSTAEITFFGSGGALSLPGIILENGTSFRIYVDASTITNTDNFYISGQYFTDA